MQAADVAHKAEVSELNKTIQRGEGRLQEQEGEIKKLTESAEAIKQNTLKTQDELRKNLERKEMELKEVQGEAAELKQKHQSVVEKLARVEQEKQRTEEQLGEKRSEAINDRENMRKRLAAANKGWGEALKTRDELRKELDRIELKLEKVQDDLADQQVCLSRALFCVCLTNDTGNTPCERACWRPRLRTRARLPRCTQPFSFAMASSTRKERRSTG